MATKKDYPNYFYGFRYYDYSAKYWKFDYQINYKQTEVLLQVNPEHIITYRNRHHRLAYVLKLDQTHCVFLSHWQYWPGFYGTYVLLTKQYYHAALSTKPYFDMPETSDLLTWDAVLQKAKSQQDSHYELGEKILIKKNKKMKG